MKRLVFALSLFLVLGTLISCGSDNEIVIDDGSANTSDVAVTGLVDEYGATYATISGYVNLQLLTSVGSNPTIGIEMSEVKTTEEGEKLENTRTESTSELIGKRFIVNFTGLYGKCQYKYRSFVKAGGITYYGGYRDFYTTDFANLTTTGNASDITFTSATVTSAVNVESIDQRESISIGLAYSTDRFKLHPDSTFNYKNFSLDRIEDASYKINLNNLLTGKTYHYASFTKAGGVYKLGEIKSFTTKSLQGYFSTGDATELTFTSATVKGTSSLASLYPEGTKITYGVRYATSEEALGFSNIPEGFIFQYRDYGYDVYYNPETKERINVSSNYSTTTASITNTSNNNLTAHLSGLTTGQTYYYCVYANVDGVLLTGNVKSFATKSTDGYLSIDDATDITFNSATLKGKTKLSHLYGQNTTIRYEFRYSTDKNTLENSGYYGYYSTITPTVVNDALIARLYNLSENKTYYYYLYAYVDGVTLKSETKQFNTGDFGGYLTTGNALDITLNSAVVTGQTKLFDSFPSTTSIDYYVYYAKSEEELSYSSSRKTIEASNEGSEINAKLSNLSPNTTYYYKITAYADGKHFYGEVKNFTTKSGEEYLTTGSPTNVTLTTANVSGWTKLSEVYPNTGQVNYYVYYANSIDGLNYPKSVEATLNGKEISASLSGLSPNTTYYYKVVAYAEGYYYYGEVKNFTTRSENEYLSTGAATNVTLNTAKVSGMSKFSEAYPNSTSIDYYVYYAKSADGLTSQNSVDAVNNGTEISATLTNLISNTTYYYKVVAKVDGNYYYGEVKNFTTKFEKNYLTTLAATNVTLNTAKLTGTSKLSDIYPSSTAIDYFIYYASTSSDFESSSKRKAVKATKNGNEINASLSGLSPNTTYYYKVGAFVNKEYYYGDAKSFTTKSEKGYLFTGAATNVTLSSADIAGTSALSELYPNKTIQYNVKYGTSSSSLTGSKAMSSNNGKLSVSLSGLSMGTTFYYRITATVDGLTLNGDVKNFTTKKDADYLTTGGATNVTLTTAKLTGTSKLSDIYPSSTAIDYFIYYASTSSDLESSSKRKSVKATKNGNEISASLSGLSPNTTYYYKVGAFVNKEYYYGEDKSFTTKSEKGYLFTGAATNVTLTSADIAGTSALSELYPNKTIQYNVKYGTSSSNLTGSKAMSSNSGKLSASLSGLSMGTTYYYCVTAKVDEIIVKGEIKSFKTKLVLDYFSTGAATNVTMTSAEISGTSSLSEIYPNKVIQYKVYYGKSNNEMSSESEMNLDNGKLSATITNLSIGTTYYYCVGVELDGVTTKGNIMTFTTNTLDSPDYVDLGLSCKWAIFNLGASSPESNGNYYAWGEVNGKFMFSTSNYIHYNKNIGNNISGTEYDAARANLGSPWRMPTKAEFEELIQKCTWKQTTYNGITGYLVTGKNGNSIFLPKTGSDYGYWTSTAHNSGTSQYAWIWSGSVNMDVKYKFFGCPIRPVL